MSSLSTRTWSNRTKKPELFDFRVLAGLTAFIITLAGGAIAFSQITVSQENRPRAAGGRGETQQIRATTNTGSRP